MADPENPNFTPETTASSKRQNPEKPTNDAILRNLAELMGQEEAKKRLFKAPQNPLEDTETEGFSKDESQPGSSPDLPEPQKPSISGSASDAARMRRQHRSANKDHSKEAPVSGEELDVIFEEDNNLSDSPVAELNEAPATVSEADTPSDILPPADPPDPRKRKSFLGKLAPIEFSAIAVISITLIVAAVMLARSIGNARAEFQQTDNPPHHTPPESLTGTLLQLSGIQCYWRERNENDRVQETSLILPVISIKSGTGTGSLQIIFRDELGKVRGDTHIYRIKDSEPDSPTTSTAITTLGTEGLLNEIQFTDYRMQEGSLKKEYWTITFKESADEENWILIDKFRMPASRLNPPH